MKKIIFILLLAASVAQAETYKWIDKQGTVHFSEYLDEVPEAYRKSATPLGIGTSVPTGTGSSVTIPKSGTFAPDVESLKERMMQDEGIMGLIRAMQDDPEMQALLSDPATLRAIQSGDTGALMTNPVFQKLLNNPRVQEIEKKVQQNGIK